MFLESFRHLIEIEALKTQNQHELTRIFQEEKRISDIEMQREKKKASIEEMNLAIKALKLPDVQLEIESLTTKLNKMKSQMDLVTSQKEQLALEGQISLLTKEINQLEENYFIALEKSEEWLHLQKEFRDFVEGSTETIENLSVEVASEINKYQETINQRTLRINSLLEQCTPSLRALYSELELKFKPHRPVAYLIDKKCSNCHMLMDSMLKLTLEEGRSLETCPTCGRLLIPETSKIY